MKKDNTRPGASPPVEKKVAQRPKRRGGEERPGKENGAQRPGASSSSPSKVVLSEPEWKARLTSSQYHVLREKGTEMPFSGKYVHHFEIGMFLCAACHEPL
ncbi:MAG: peptide-methionine (R)-S-oxide reductase, partial [Candidatus Micrarchaeota archaeon]